MFLIRDDVLEIKAKYADPRRTVIIDEEAGAFTNEDLIPHQEVVVTLSHGGYVKRMPKDTYRVQRRGGRGVAGMETRGDDVVQNMMLADTHDILLFFTNKGRVTSIKCHRVPPAQSRTAKGLHVNNLINMEPGEMITAPIQVKDFEAGGYILMASRGGEIKKTPLEAFANIRSNGLKAFTLEPGDELVSATLATDEDDYIIITKLGQALMANVGLLRSASRGSGGVRGIKLQGRDEAIAMDLVLADHHLIVMSINGVGKLTRLDSHHAQKRGGTGVLWFKVTGKSGPLVAAMVVNRAHELMVISEQGTVFRTMLKEIRVLSRITQGVNIMKPDTGDSVASLACSEGQTELVNGSGSNGHIPSK